MCRRYRDHDTRMPKRISTNLRQFNGVLKNEKNKIKNEYRNTVNLVMIREGYSDTTPLDWEPARVNAESQQRNTYRKGKS